jgi:hypothetical protein
LGGLLGHVRQNRLASKSEPTSRITKIRSVSASLWIAPHCRTTHFGPLNWQFQPVGGHGVTLSYPRALCWWGEERDSPLHCTRVKSFLEKKS